MLALVLAMALCLSVTSQYSSETDERIKVVSRFWPSACPHLPSLGREPVDG